MLLQEFLAFFEQKAPKITAEEWDNVGLLVDCGHTNITKAVVALDATKAALTFAKENGFDYFTTTLSISPLKNAETLNRIGKEMSEKHGVEYLFSDFKKRGGYLHSIEFRAGSSVIT